MCLKQRCSAWACTGEKQKPLEKNAGEKTIAWLDKLRNSNGSLPTAEIRLNMQRIMQNNAAVFRTQETLEEGIPIYKCFFFGVLLQSTCLLPSSPINVFYLCFPGVKTSSETHYKLILLLWPFLILLPTYHHIWLCDCIAASICVLQVVSWLTRHGRVFMMSK